MLDSRESIRLELHRRLQADLDQIRSGLIIDRVSLRDIHPPVAVAPVFQEIVSAIEEKEAIIHESEQYRLEHLPTARGAASDLITKAEAAAASRKIAANSHAHRLGLQAAARAKAPSLYETREGYRAFDQSLAGAKKIITDDSLSQGTPLHLDLRRVLNSNLIDTAPPAAEPLISDPSKRRDQFNLHVEGYR
jgi:regulator of protease activity HflC (stomatin/prohibitin superfamily)